MRKIKKVTAVLLTGAMLAGANVSTYAVTPQYRPPKTDFTIEDIINAVENYLKEHPIDIDIDKIDAPEITEAIYRHSKAFYEDTRLQARWSEVENADHYEIKITKTNGDSKTYTSNYESLTVNEGSDNFIIDCVRSGKIKVRAVSANGNYSNWSEEKTISCNSLHAPSHSNEGEMENVDKPVVTQAIYYHKKLYFNRARLQVRWEEIPEASYYEVMVTKKSGESKVYKTSDTSLFVYNGADEFVNDCVRSGKVEVRAVNDNVKSDWSNAVTISCNSLHR